MHFCSIHWVKQNIPNQPLPGINPDELPTVIRRLIASARDEERQVAELCAAVLKHDWNKAQHIALGMTESQPGILTLDGAPVAAQDT